MSDILLVIILLAAVIILLALDRFPVDVITIGMMAVLLVTGTLTTEEAFKGFNSDFMIILASIFIISGAFQETGLIDKTGSVLVRLIRGNKFLFPAYIFLITALLSAFMNNTTVTALVIGPVLGMCRSLNLAPSKVLMPVAFASMLGGTCTLIGTSTNVAVSGYIAQAGMQPLDFFEVTRVGVILVAVGMIYVLTVGRWLLPENKTTSFTESYELRQYLTEIVVLGNSKLIGQQVFKSDLAQKNITIVKVIRNKEDFIPARSTIIENGDTLLVECRLDDLIKFKQTAGIEILADHISDTSIQSSKIKLAEVLITPNSSLQGKSLKEARFRLNYDVVALAIHRFDETLANKIGSIILKTGDMLLVQGANENIDALRNSSDFTVLGDFRVNLFRERKGIFSFIIFMAAVIAGTIGLLPLSVSFLVAAFLIVLSGALNAEKVYQSIDWRLLVLIGGMSAMGTAMTKSGASEFFASKIITAFSPMGEIYVLAAFAVLVVFLTQPLSNAAAALVVLPVALNAAELIHINPRTLSIVIMLSASISFITPFEPACILVYGPGKYKFMDYIKTGLPLTLLMILFILLIVPLFWPLHP